MFVYGLTHPTLKSKTERLFSSYTHPHAQLHTTLSPKVGSSAVQNHGAFSRLLLHNEINIIFYLIDSSEFKEKTMFTKFLRWKIITSSFIWLCSPFCNQRKTAVITKILLQNGKIEILAVWLGRPAGCSTSPYYWVHKAIQHFRSTSYAMKSKLNMVRKSNSICSFELSFHEESCSPNKARKK